MSCFLGIDAGTSVVKVVLFDTNGNELKIARIENEPLYIGDSMVEQDMDILWDKVLQCIKDITLSTDVDTKSILGIGLTGQGEGCWLVDKNMAPVDKAILWCDGRAKSEIDKLVEKGLAKKYEKIAGVGPNTSATAMIMKWILENKKETLDKAYKVLFCKDWIRYKLTGKINLEISDAGTSLLDLRTGQISDELLELLDLSPYKRLFSEILKSHEIVGTITKEIAKETGLSETVAVGAGAVDVVASTVGMGAIKNGQMNSTIGTTCSTSVVIDKSKSNLDNPDARYECHAVDNMLVKLYPTMSGTPNIDWAIDNISDSKDFNQIEKNLEDIPAGSGGIIYHPYISTAGERTPFYNPYARSNFFGVSMETTRYHLIKSVYEGIALSIKDCLYGFDDEGTIFISGGGAKSGIWPQIIADCTGRKVVTTYTSEAACKGVVLLTAVSLGIYKDMDEAVEKTTKIKEEFEPNPKNQKIYDTIYKSYREFRLINNDLWIKFGKSLEEVK